MQGINFILWKSDLQKLILIINNLLKSG